MVAAGAGWWSWVQQGTRAAAKVEGSGGTGTGKGRGWRLEVRGSTSCIENLL